MQKVCFGCFLIARERDRESVRDSLGSGTSAHSCVPTRACRTAGGVAPGLVQAEQETAHEKEEEEEEERGGKGERQRGLHPAWGFSPAPSLRGG